MVLFVSRWQYDSIRRGDQWSPVYHPHQSKRTKEFCHRSVPSPDFHRKNLQFVDKTEKVVAKYFRACYNAPCVRSRAASIGMSPSGKAPDFDSGIRRFKSCHPSQSCGVQRLSPTTNDPLAQLAEQLPFKQWVWSSNLQRVTRKREIPFGISLFLFPAEIRKTQMQQGVFCKGRFYPFTKYT